jgi:hypothetical protein
VSDTWDEEDRAIARAIDVSEDSGPVDERAVDAYREVLGHFPVEGVTPPSDLEDRVVATALAHRSATTSTLDRARAQRRARLRAATLGAVAVAAAIIVAVLVMTHDSSSPVPTGRITSVAASRPDIDALLRRPGTRTGTFDHGGAKVVMGQSGKGSVYALAPSAVVGVWVESERGTLTSLGSAFPTDGAIAFSVDHPNLVTAVRLTRRDGTLLARAMLSAG